MGLARVREIEEWATDSGGTYAWRGYFGSRPNGRTGIRRVRLGSLLGESGPASNYAELHTDGAGFACEDVGRKSPEGDGSAEAIQIRGGRLLWALAQMLHLLGRHAVENTGAWGDAFVVARLFGGQMQLTRPIHQGMIHEPWNHQPMGDSVASQHTLPLDSLAGSDQDLLVATRLVATDLVNSFGSPEVREIDEQGRIRLRYVGERQHIENFAQAHGVEVSHEEIQG